MDIEITLSTPIEEEETIALYRANDWSSAKKPKELLAALRNSHSLVVARTAGKGVGRKMMEAMQTVYGSFHQQMLTADGEAIEFYKKSGF